jgi:uncharacterized protein YqgC (DUF456 family)
MSRLRAACVTSTLQPGKMPAAAGRSSQGLRNRNHLDSAWIWLLAVLLVMGGVAGSVLPALPGVPLVFLGLLVAAWGDGFQRVGWITIALLGVLTAVSFGIDLAATALGAKRVGASRLAIVGAAIGTLAGVFFGVPGLLIGPFAGAMTGELLSRGELQQAARAGMATWLGLVFGTLVKLALVFTMIGIFTFAWFV